MKARIFNRGKGWYITAVNYKDKDDKKYISLYFPNGTEQPDADLKDGWCSRDIDILEARHNCYKGEVGMTIFKWRYADELDENKTFVDSIQGTKYAEKFGDVKIDTNELPFY